MSQAGDEIRVIEGDCLQVLPTLEAGSVDAIVTDPPYGIVNKFADSIGSDGSYRRLSFAWDTPDITRKVTEAITAAIPALGPKGALFTFCGMDQVGPIQDVLRKAGMTPKPAAWIKTCPPPAGHGNWWPSGFEIAIYAYRPGAWFGDTDPKRSNVFVGDSMRFGQPGKVDHPTQKPFWLMRRIVSAICPPGGLILDPFAGSGSTLVAALKSGRRAIGIEIKPRYVQTARRRLADAATPLFGGLAP
jgi:site-specific DNA-methyltransferase (adenine-specific)